MSMNIDHKLLQAELIWDGRTLVLPADMGTPRPDQLTSTPLDNLVEMCGRVCYDSLGSGRDSASYHQHINDVNHGSVQEHANITLETPNLSFVEVLPWCMVMLNRPGTHTRIKQLGNGSFACRMTLNLRAIREFEKFECPIGAPAHQAIVRLHQVARQVSPLVMGNLSADQPPSDYPLNLVDPETDDEIWCSFYMHGVSRGFSHEQVRHKWRTAVSQRSTRYVNESESPWCPHPLLKGHPMLLWAFYMVQTGAQKVYDLIVAQLQATLQKKLIDGGMDASFAKTNARKQARGAARGVLGNALETKLVFSASIAEWKHMLRMRACDAADAEIRMLFAGPIFSGLMRSFPDRFAGWTTQPASDGCGDCVVQPAVVVKDEVKEIDAGHRG